MKLKVATWNVNSVIARLERVLNFLKTEEPDVVCLQELKCLDEKFPKEEFSKLGYHSESFGQKAYNGVAVLSKHPMTQVTRSFKGCPDEASRAIGVLVKGLYIYSLYIPNGKDVEDPAFQYKLKWLKGFQKYIQTAHSKKEGVLLTGDFNIAHTDLDVYDPVRWKGKLHCSAIEREHIDDLLSVGFKDSYRMLHPTEKEYSWWDYRHLSFPKNYGLRIDYIYSSISVAERVEKCWMMGQERKGEKPSDHVPVIVEIGL